MVRDKGGCIVVNDVGALEQALRRKHRVPILFTENGRDLMRIWPGAKKRVDDRLLEWCRDVLVAFQGAMTRSAGKTANAV